MVASVTGAHDAGELAGYCESLQHVSLRGIIVFARTATSDRAERPVTAMNPATNC